MKYAITVCLLACGALHASFISSATATAGCYDSAPMFASCSGIYGSASASVMPTEDGVQYSLSATGTGLMGPFGGQAEVRATYEYLMRLDGWSGQGWASVDLNSYVPFVIALIPDKAKPFTFGQDFSAGFSLWAASSSDDGRTVGGNGRVSIATVNIYLHDPNTTGMAVLSNTGITSAYLPIDRVQIWGLSTDTSRQFITDALVAATIPAPEPTGLPVLVAVLCTVLWCRIGTRLHSRPPGSGPTADSPSQANC